MKPSPVFGEFVRWYVKFARHPLKDKLVGHYWSWFSRLKLWLRYDDNLLIRVSLKDYIGREIFNNGHYEKTLINFLKRELRPTDIVWDIGANIGAVSIAISRKCTSVFAFEPDPRTRKDLWENKKANHLNNIFIHEMALGDQEGEIQLYQADSLNTGMTSIFQDRPDLKSVSSVTVPIAQLDSFVSKNPSAFPTVLKIDVEGAEDHVLAGAQKTLATKRVRFIVFESRISKDGSPANTRAVEILKGLGYAIRQLGQSDVAVDDGMRNFLAFY